MPDFIGPVPSVTLDKDYIYLLNSILLLCDLFVNCYFLLIISKVPLSTNKIIKTATTSSTKATVAISINFFLSVLGVLLFEISPFLAFVQRFVPRLLAGLLSGLIYRWVEKLINGTVSGFVTGFCAALLNTILFMLSLILLFGNTEYLRNLIGGRNIILFICAFVGINAVVEMIAATLAVGAIGKVLQKVVMIRRK